MGAATGFQHYLGRRQLGAEGLELRPGHVLAQDGLIPLIDPVQGKGGFRGVDRETLELHRTGLSRLIIGDD
ncbi:hypothetical protein CTJ15_02695 (plasmid) [Roseomonas sp. FDAARGOS_362]|nr:hypothetical protein CTJ15_02695 [Roseomonas sp. FDAARGOS_362]